MVGGAVLTRRVSSHVTGDVQPENPPGNDGTCTGFMLIGFFPSKIKQACLASVLKRLWKQNAFVTEPKTLGAFLA